MSSFVSSRRPRSTRRSVAIAEKSFVTEAKSKRVSVGQADYGFRRDPADWPRRKRADSFEVLDVQTAAEPAPEPRLLQGAPQDAGPSQTSSLRNLINPLRHRLDLSPYRNRSRNGVSEGDTGKNRNGLPAKATVDGVAPGQSLSIVTSVSPMTTPARSSKSPAWSS